MTEEKRRTEEGIPVITEEFLRRPNVLEELKLYSATDKIRFPPHMRSENPQLYEDFDKRALEYFDYGALYPTASGRSKFIMIHSAIPHRVSMGVYGFYALLKDSAKIANVKRTAEGLPIRVSTERANKPGFFKKLFKDGIKALDDENPNLLRASDIVGRELADLFYRCQESRADSFYGGDIEFLQWPTVIGGHLGYNLLKKAGEDIHVVSSL